MEPSTQTPPYHADNAVSASEYSHGLTHILLLVLGIIIGSGAMWGYQKFFVRPVDILQPVPLPIATPTPTLSDNNGPSPEPSAPSTPTPTLDPSVTWKTFTDQKIGYSVNYPLLPGFGRLVCKDEPNMLYFIKGIQTEPLTVESCPRDSRYNLEIVTKAGVFNDTDNYYYNTSSSNITVDGIKATKTVHTLKGAPEGPIPDWYITIRFDKDSIFYEAYTADRDLEKYLDQMLTTFKFI